MEREARIYVSGMQTTIGSALLRELRQQGYENLVGVNQEEPDLTDPSQVDSFFAQTKPEYVFMAAGMSGGIQANQRYPAQLMRDNLLAESHIIHSTYQHRAKKLLYLASSCCYPKGSPQPMQVESLMSGPLEPTNEAYALAKLAGIGLCRAYADQYGVQFVSGIPADAFGPGDDFSPENSHVVPALIRRMHESKAAGSRSVAIWGTGNPRRDVAFAGEIARAGILVMEEYNGREPINLACGTDVSIKELATLIQEVVGYSGDLLFDSTKPDGMPAKILDATALYTLGWRPRTSLSEALATTYDWFVQHRKIDRGDDTLEDDNVHSTVR
jgi:GDP-L-fucose synthase